MQLIWLSSLIGSHACPLMAAVAAIFPAFGPRRKRHCHHCAQFRVRYLSPLRRSGDGAPATSASSIGAITATSPTLAAISIRREKQISWRLLCALHHWSFTFILTRVLSSVTKFSGQWKIVSHRFCRILKNSKKSLKTRKIWLKCSWCAKGTGKF
jgi:hypothetical protein